MPKIYLSPSTQEFNMYYSGNYSEEQVMNLLADLLEPYLYANGIEFVRNDPSMTAASSIRASNAGNYDFHLALHSNASPESIAGQLRGTHVYFFPYSYNGERMADILAANFREIYPDPTLVKAIPTTALGEVDRTRAPAVLLEVAYHDNPEDEQWILDNLSQIAAAIALSLTEYFGLPFIEPSVIYKGQVVTETSGLNIRNRPSLTGTVLTSAPKGAYLDIYGETQDGWMSVGYGDILGYARSEFIEIVD